jgi:hypothetical protein
LWQVHNCQGYHRAERLRNCLAAYRQSYQERRNAGPTRVL